ncbi:hypothetical protein PGT21_012967 [Puccinia graminis f. sp. tritici]|uniref:Uncharacterized protein n=1 Tax=Puccinia graminis f. sp. tritici TaxID=56615 RepID=A0A5B0P5T4_PUCGR|nr:hypothetical protein PGT21_012967 [Puccinia graminis f. sp. tritici]KAA1132102.1 hypothetical protein PGTUg99_037109 [Puccinia graminis f. sp. tritici]
MKCFSLSAAVLAAVLVSVSSSMQVNVAKKLAAVQDADSAGASEYGGQGDIKKFCAICEKTGKKCYPFCPK